MSSSIKPKKDKILFKGYKGFIKLFSKKVKFIYLGEKFDKSSLIVCNHEGTKSPLAFELFCDKKVRFWGNEEMNSGLIRLYNYQTKVYYHQKKHWNLFLARLYCLLASPLTNFFYKGLNLISIRKGTGLMKTIKDSYTCLNEYQENIVVFPEISDKGYLEVLEGFHEGFLLLAEYSYKRGLDLPIVVSYLRKKEGICVVDEPILYSELIKNGASRIEIAQRLCSRCNELGQMDLSSYMNNK